MYKKFADLLLKNNKTTYRVAKDTGISPTPFFRLEKGKSKPKVDKLQILADYFGVPLDYFLKE